MKKIRVALIGYGRSGRNIHRKLLLQLPDKYEFVAFVEQDKERREMIERENGMQALSDYRELFGRTDIDLVINASFSFDHARISYDLLTNGFDVLSEKPASGNVNDFECALKAAKEHGRQYFIFQQYRFAPAYMKMREIVGQRKARPAGSVHLQFRRLRPPLGLADRARLLRRQPAQHRPAPDGLGA